VVSNVGQIAVQWQARRLLAMSDATFELLPRTASGVTAQTFGKNERYCSDLSEGIAYYASIVIYGTNL
jgi:hypothetical protein